MKKKQYYGCLESTPDPRDYHIQIVGTATYPKQFMVTDDPPAYNQGQIGSCVIQALRGAPHAATGVEMGTSFAYGYWRSHKLVGLYVNEALAGFVRDGFPPRSVDNVDLEVEEVIDYAHRNAERMLKAAEPYKGWTYAKINTIDEIKAVVYGSRNHRGQRCFVGLPVVDQINGWWRTTGGPQIGRHALAIVGWDDDKQAVILRNSWGEPKGMFQNGTCYLYCTYDEILANTRELYALIPPEKVEPEPDEPVKPKPDEPKEDIKVVRTLRLTDPYMRGDDVKHAQERLIVHGYNITADGIFGKKTYNAVREFQAAKKLSIDGIIGKNTLAALNEDPAVTPPAPVIDEELRADFISYLYKQLGNIYCWGGNGEDATDYAIDIMEDSSANKRRAKAFLAKQKKAGVQNIKMYDCSGLISRWLQDHGMAKSKCNCNRLWAMSSKIAKADLQPCDLLFRGSDSDKNHVGVYMGNGMVIESKGRDDGVVIRPIDATAGYWKYYGRLNIN
nr:MAG TPA: lysozyme family protein [Caudoviricetes sp.]